MADMRITNTLGPKDAGDIATALKSIPEGDTKTVAYLGAIFGMASGISYRSNKYSDEPSIALVGVFEAQPFDVNGAVVRGNSMYLNQAVQQMLVKAMMGETPHSVQKAPKLGSKIDVDLGMQMPVKAEIGLVRSAGEGVGYRFIINMIGDAAKVDVLDELRREIISESASERVKRLGDVHSGVQQIGKADVKKLAPPAPVKAATKRGGKK